MCRDKKGTSPSWFFIKHLSSLPLKIQSIHFVFNLGITHVNQPVVVSANVAPTVIPNLGCGEEGNFIQCKTAQLWYSMAVRQLWTQEGLGPDPSLNEQLCYAPPWSFLLLHSIVLCWSFPFCASLLWPALVCSTSPARHLWYFSFARKTSSVGRESMLSEP